MSLPRHTKKDPQSRERKKKEFLDQRKALFAKERALRIEKESQIAAKKRQIPLTEEKRIEHTNVIAKKKAAIERQGSEQFGKSTSTEVYNSDKDVEIENEEQLAELKKQEQELQQKNQEYQEKIKLAEERIKKAEEVRAKIPFMKRQELEFLIQSNPSPLISGSMFPPPKQQTSVFNGRSFMQCVSSAGTLLVQALTSLISMIAVVCSAEHDDASYRYRRRTR